MDIQQNTGSLAQPVTTTPEVEVKMPKRRNKAWIYVGITAGLIALIALTVAITILLTGKKDSTNGTVDQNIVSSPNQETLPEQETPAEKTKDISFDINTSVWNGSKSINVNLVVPEDSTYIQENSSHILGYRIINGANSMYVFIPYESMPTAYTSLTVVGANSQFGTISRFTTSVETDKNTYMYTTNDNLNGICKSPEGMYGYSEPCGERFMGTANGEYIFISCPTTSKDFCDKAVLSINVKTTVVEESTKSISAEIDFGEWMSQTVQKFEVANVPMNATYTQVSEQGNRVKGYRIQNENFSLLLYYPYESFPGQILSEEGNITNEQFGTIKRLKFKDAGDNSYYVNQTNYFDCSEINVSGWEGKCAGFFMKESDGTNGEHIFAICEKGFETCDKIIATLKVSSRQL